MQIRNFNQLLSTARAQATPQRLLLVFAGVELDDAATPEQRAAFEAGHGGTLVPLMCVDKAPDEITDFAALCKESHQAGPAWVLVFAAALSGEHGQTLDSDAAIGPLKRMVEDIRHGTLRTFLAFDTEGHTVQLD